MLAACYCAMRCASQATRIAPGLRHAVFGIEANHTATCQHVSGWLCSSPGRQARLRVGMFTSPHLVKPSDAFRLAEDGQAWTQKPQSIRVSELPLAGRTLTSTSCLRLSKMRSLNPAVSERKKPMSGGPQKATDVAEQLPSSVRYTWQVPVTDQL